MKINHAILHIFDFVSCVNVMAQEELDLKENKNAKNYALRLARKTLGNLDNMRGEFAPDSLFAPELRAYFRHERDFVDLSIQIAEFLARELNHAEKATSTDLLVLDFEDDPDQTVREMTDEEAEAAFEAQGRRYFALILLESKQAFMHEVGQGETGLTSNTVARHHAILPNPSQKIPSYAIIDAQTMEVWFCDKPRTIAGQERWLIPDGLLQCSMQASAKETFEAVTRIVEEVAEEYGENVAVATAKAKAYAMENADETDELSPEELGRAVFEDNETLQRRFEEHVQEEELPERVTVEKKVVQRVAKNHKIRTDTGIEITFPAEYSQNPDFIEFTSMPDGRISISLKNIAHIENR